MQTKSMNPQNLNQAITHLQALPPQEQYQAFEFIEFLFSKSERKNTPNILVPKKRRAGTLKGQITLADDFDAPLDDFKEYL